MNIDDYIITFEKDRKSIVSEVKQIQFLTFIHLLKPF